MRGFHPYERDLAIPTYAGQPGLSPPTGPQLLELVAQSLCVAEVSPVAAQVVYARWKPGVAVAAAYAVSFSDGSDELITYKRHIERKAQQLVVYEPRPGETLRAWSPLESGVSSLWRFPNDRVLRSLSRFAVLDRTIHRIDRSGLFPGRVVRRRPSRLEVVRYKPERRAIFKLSLKLRGADGERSESELGARLHPPSAAERIIAARRSCFGTEPSLGPRVLGWDADQHLLLEEWVTGSIPTDDDFSAAGETGELLARLHALPMKQGGEPVGNDRPSLEGCFQVAPQLSRLAGQVPRVRMKGRPTCWIHGDLHPGQVIRDAASHRLRLLDLDALRIGRPEEDLATFIADRLQVSESEDFDVSTEDIVLGYDREKLDERLLRALVAEQLVRLAAGGIRRLQADAVERARCLLMQAGRLTSRRWAL